MDVAIYETYHGGDYDTTNIIRIPIAAAITPNVGSSSGGPEQRWEQKQPETFLRI